MWTQLNPVNKYKPFGCPRRSPNGLVLVRAKGLEPPRRVALDPKSSASANSATPAFGGANIGIFFKWLPYNKDRSQKIGQCENFSLFFLNSKFCPR